MARPKKSPSLNLNDEIQRRGILMLLHDDSTDPAVETMQADFYAWLREENSAIFTRLSEEFAAKTVAEMKGAGGNGGS